MTRRRMKIATMIPLVTGVAVVIVYIVIGVSGSRTSDVTFQSFVASTGRSILSMTAQSSFDDLSSLDVYALQRTVKGLIGNVGIVYAGVRDAGGRIQAEEPAGGDVLGEQAVGLAALAFGRQDIVSREEGHYLILCGPIGEGVDQVGTLTIVYDRALVLQEPSRITRNIMLPLVLFFSAMSILTVTVITHRATRPLRALVGAAEEIGRGNLDVEVPIRGLEETAVLGQALERMRVDLQALYQDLEQQVDNLERRTSYLEATAAVAHQAASVLRLDELLSRATTLISQRLSFYHSAIFLVDPSGEWAVMDAASSEGGRRMQERGHRLRVGGESIVGYVSSQGYHYLALDVGDDATHFDNPDLPNTRSEIALPLRARGEIIGVLDVQSLEPEAFSSEDVAVLQTLADQVAMAISNARLFQQAQAALEAERRAYGEFTRQAWAETLRRQLGLGYYCDASGVKPLDNALGDDGGVESAMDGGGDMPTFSLPISARDQVIGTIRVRKPGDTGEWTAAEVALLETLVDQLGVALEGAQLYQETRQRATREQLTAEVTSRIRETLDMDAVLQTAIREIGEALDIAEVEVRMSRGVMVEE